MRPPLSKRINNAVVDKNQPPDSYKAQSENNNEKSLERLKQELDEIKL